MSVYLPATARPEREGAEPRPAAARGRGERVLVVEDEPAVRSLTQRLLEAAGYAAVQAPNGAAALAFLASHRGDIDLVLTDVVMPNLNGPQLAAEGAKRHPGLPLIFMSAYSGDEMARRGVALSGAFYIAKPFDLETLARAVRECLDRARPPA